MLTVLFLYMVEPQFGQVFVTLQDVVCLFPVPVHGRLGRATLLIHVVTVPHFLFLVPVPVHGRSTVGPQCGHMLSLNNMFSV